MNWDWEINYLTILDYLRVAVEFLLISTVIYKILYYLRGTRAANVLAGLVVAFLTLSIIANSLGLNVLRWLLDNFLSLIRNCGGHLPSWGVFRFFSRTVSAKRSMN